jgi:hypothetical protein
MNVRVSTLYGKSRVIAKAVKGFERAMGAFRCELDNVAASDISSDQFHGLYYGHEGLSDVIPIRYADIVDSERRLVMSSSGRVRTRGVLSLQEHRFFDLVLHRRPVLAPVNLDDYSLEYQRGRRLFNAKSKVSTLEREAAYRAKLLVQELHTEWRRSHDGYGGGNDSLYTLDTEHRFKATMTDQYLLEWMDHAYPPLDVAEAESHRRHIKKADAPVIKITPDLGVLVDATVAALCASRDIVVAEGLFSRGHSVWQRLRHSDGSMLDRRYPTSLLRELLSRVVSWEEETRQGWRLARPPNILRNIELRAVEWAPPWPHEWAQ